MTMHDDVIFHNASIHDGLMYVAFYDNGGDNIQVFDISDPYGLQLEAATRHGARASKAGLFSGIDVFFRF